MNPKWFSVLSSRRTDRAHSRLLENPREKSSRDGCRVGGRKSVKGQEDSGTCPGGAGASCPCTGRQA